MSAATAAGALGPRPRPPSRRRVLGRHPLGLAFVAPYAVFLAAIFAYPLGLAVWISFHDYFFTAPGRGGGPAVRRPGQLRRRRCRTPTCAPPSCTSASSWSSTCRSPWRSRSAWPSRSTRRCRSAPSCASPTTSRTSRRASRWSRCGCSCSAATGWSTSCSARWPRPVVAGQQHLGHAGHRHLRHLEAARVLHPAVPRGAAERAEGAVRGGGDGRRDQVALLPQRHRAGGPPGDRRWWSCWPSSRARTCSPSPTC